jgi:hypothetical protein
MSPEQLSFMIGSFYGSVLTLLLFPPNRRSRNRRDSFLDCHDRSGPQFNEGRAIRGNGNGGPTTPKPEFPPGRVTDVHGSTIGYRPIPSGRDTIPPPRNP